MGSNEGELGREANSACGLHGSVAHATSRAGASLRDQVKYGACYKHEAFAAIKEVVKVDVRQSGDVAKQEGWDAHSRGNNAADEIAKLDRPKLQCSAKKQTAKSYFRHAR